MGDELDSCLVLSLNRKTWSYSGPDKVISILRTKYGLNFTRISSVTGLHMMTLYRWKVGGNARKSDMDYFLIKIKEHLNGTAYKCLHRKTAC